MKKIRIFAVNVLFLTATTLIMRTIGVSFNVYLSQKLGSAGMGLFTLISSVYGFGITFALSGVNLAASRLVAEALGRNNPAELRGAMLRCLLYGVSFGLTGATVLFALAGPIGTHLLEDIRTVSSLRILALSLPLTSAASALSGYFSAVRRTAQSSAAQIIGQLFRISITAYLLSLFLPAGLEYACLAVSGGSALSECLVCLILYLLYRKDLSCRSGRGEICSPGLTGRLLSTALPVALSTYVRSGLVTVEHLLIPRGLRRFGMGSEGAISTYGVFSGMVMPIVLYPMAFLSACAGMLIPEIAQDLVADKRRHIDYIAARSCQITLLFAIGCAGYMLCFSHELGSVIYGSAEAGRYIRIMAPLIPVMYLDHITDGLLKGLGEQLFVMRVNIFDASLSCLLVWLLLPHTGMMGYIVIVYLCEILNTALSLCRLMNKTEFSFRIGRWLLLPLSCAVFSSWTVRLFFDLSRIVLPWAGGETILHAVLAISLYLLLLLLTGALSREDLRWLGGIFAHEKKKSGPSATALPEN